jgi:hypothetical protein
VIAVPRIKRIRIELGRPSQLKSNLSPIMRYASAKVIAPVIEYSYIFPSGIRSADIPRAITARVRDAVANKNTMLATFLDLVVILRSRWLSPEILLARSENAVS